MRFLKSCRKFSANARYELPPFAGEPFKHYAPGSQEAINLTASLKKFKSEVFLLFFFSFNLFFKKKLTI